MRGDYRGQVNWISSASPANNVTVMLNDRD
jgi:hypothetical protein